MLTMQCLDLTPNADGVHNDPHGLKPNLRRGDFVIAGPLADVQPIMPWQQILRELVGYTKYVQSLLPDPVSAPLEEMRRLIALDAARLRELLANGRNDAVVTLIQHGEVVPATEHAAPGGDQTLTNPTQMLARMHSLINT